MMYSENKDHLESLLSIVGDPATNGDIRVRICGQIMCYFPPSLVQKVIAERKEGWLGNIGQGCRTMAQWLADSCRQA